jgi:hypothetical protein
VFNSRFSWDLNGLQNKIKKQRSKPPTVVLEHRLLFKKVTSLQAATNSKHLKDLSKREVPQRIQSVPSKSLETAQDQGLARSQKKINHGTNYLKKILGTYPGRDRWGISKSAQEKTPATRIP